MLPWLPIIAAGSTLLSSLFGKDTTESQTQNSATTGATVGSTKLNGSQSTNQTQNQRSNQRSNQSTNESSTTGQTGSANVSRLDAETLDQLTGQVRNLLAGADQGSVATRSRLAEVQGAPDNFDSDAYVSGIMAAANDTIGSGMESDLAKIESGSGGSRRANSNTALLASKVRSGAAAQLAGVKSDAIGKASELARTRQESKTGQISNLAAQTDTSVVNLLGSLLQASEKQSNQQTGTSVATGNTAGTTVGDTTTSTVEKSSQVQTQDQATTQTSATKTTASGKKNEGGGFGGIFDAIGDILKIKF